MKNSKIAEAYIHISLDTSELFRDKSRIYLYNTARKYAEDLIKTDLIYDVRVEEGSFKAWAAIFGTLSTLYAGVCNYGSFRSGIDQIVTDYRPISDHIISDFLNDSNAPQNTIVRTERRTGIPGKIQRIYNKIDKLEHIINEMSPRGVQNELQKVKQEIALILSKLDEQDRALFLDSLPQPIKDDLPQLPTFSEHHLYYIPDEDQLLRTNRDARQLPPLS